MTGEMDAVLRRHLLRDDGQEDICFALWRPSNGLFRKTALIAKMLLPERGERNVHGNARFNPEYLLRAMMLSDTGTCAMIAKVGLRCP
jgi:molybdopterin-synthase adenylyltransferase